MLDSLGHYVYALLDPETNEIFYVGKARATKSGMLNLRPTAHFKGGKNSDKLARINEIRERGFSDEDMILILRHNLRSDEEALTVEAAVIDALGKQNLTNINSGHDVKHGAMKWTHMKSRFSRSFVDFTELEDSAREQNCIYSLFHVKNTYKPNITATELYDATRMWWRIRKDLVDEVNSGRGRTHIALACVEDAIIEAYEVKHWFSAGETFTSRHSDKERLGIRNGNVEFAEKFEFAGNVASKEHSKYIGSRLTQHNVPFVWGQKPWKHFM